LKRGRVENPTRAVSKNRKIGERVDSQGQFRRWRLPVMVPGHGTRAAYFDLKWEIFCSLVWNWVNLTNRL